MAYAATSWPQRVKTGSAGVFQDSSFLLSIPSDVILSQGYVTIFMLLIPIYIFCYSRFFSPQIYLDVIDITLCKFKVHSVMI